MTRAARLPAVIVTAGPLILVGVLTVLAWPIANSPTRATLDGSWQIALHQAAEMGLRHGVDIVFTHGPLGFLGFSHPYVGATSTLALIAAIAVYLALVGTMLVEARRILPLWAAALVTLLAARTFVYLPPFEASLALVFVWCVEILAGRITKPLVVVAIIGGVLAGASLLGKVNVGIFVLAVGTLTAVFAGGAWWKTLAVFLGTAAVSGLGLWLASGQQLTDLVAYATGVYQMIGGYNEAMGADPLPKRTWIYLALAATAAIVVWSGWQTSRDWPTRQRVGLAVLGLVFGFAMWKTAAVREHATYVFATAIVVMFAFAGSFDRRSWLVAVLAVGIAFAGSSTIEPKLYFDVVGSTRSFAGEVRDAFLPGRGAVVAQRTRDSLRRQYRLEPDVLAAIDGGTVHIDPHLTSVAYAYPEIRWDPVPIFQSYAAFTPPLDRLNADVLRSPSAPERILRSFTAAVPTDQVRLWIGRPLREGEVLTFSVDGRFRWFESPEATLEMFCRYAQTTVSDRWQVLAPTGRSCGPAEALGTVTARAGDTVEVPVEARPDRFVVVKIRGLEPSPLGRLLAILRKGPDWYVRIDDTRYRLIPATATDGLLMAVPSVADGTGNFEFGGPIRTLEVTQGLDEVDPGVDLTFEFLSVPLLEP